MNYLISYRYRESVLNQLFAEEFGDDRKVARGFYLSAEQMREMDAPGMVIGSHGLNHYVFSKLPSRTSAGEISTSFADLSRISAGPSGLSATPMAAAIPSRRTP